ncbi:Dehydrodolichyl diphosphate synthase 6 [Hibiscus syriacus]|uniref:Alkyl transferase n=1 Tax=Hibiscus syriacus TaxID=106335 RepID=A0A6A3BYH8_HIBSY|nr:dehydrodolichyl diphosphate synthase CPT3-like [Hibiscus syriacus]KAE8721007.1 Dehydrodolichyl diphosphate synthase 6 [Hibiscus syriacus]
MESEPLSRKIFTVCKTLVRKLVFRVLRTGPMPSHIAVIMDGNRRYAKRNRLNEGAGHDAGAMALFYLINYCYELGIKYITAYAFSTDNFRRKPQEVGKIMSLLRESIALLTKITKNQPVRVHFAGNLELLSAELRDGARKLMEATAEYSKIVVTICVCYCCSDEILHSVEQSCLQKYYKHSYVRDSHDDENGERDVITLVDIEKHMYMAVTPDPDILIRTAHEHRLSNFLQWQTSYCQLASLPVDFPELNSWQLTWVILNFQRSYKYLARKKLQR